MSIIATIGASVLLGRAKKAATGALDWVTGNAARLLIVALAGVALWGWIGHHQAAKWERVAVQTQNARKADNRTWATVDRINHQSIRDLIAALDGQSAMIRTWAQTSNRRQIASQAALRAATARGERLEALAHRIEAVGAERASGGPECRTGRAVLDAKGEL